MDGAAGVSIGGLDDVDRLCCSLRVESDGGDDDAGDFLRK